MESVQESWRVVDSLHAQSRFTLHQAAADREEGFRRFCSFFLKFKTQSDKYIVFYETRSVNTSRTSSPTC